ncbi:uncharacterized protein BDV14DRAFT_178258 [Aspergillus stella-maris]|uniref:uncharacterized protein n=1 Tax=Aspergillus stella-maris TaxID=1810926 RepID=UPI003CCE2935
MTRHMAEMNWSAIFMSAFLALAISLWWHRSLRQSPKTTSQRKRGITLRIEQVPIGKPREALEGELRCLVEENLTLKGCATSLEQLLVTPRDQRIACATATFNTSIPPDEFIQILRHADPHLEYEFDHKFYGITPLYEAPTAEVDVIAVPGLGSNAIGSWKSPSSNRLWLRDFLPDDVPNIRILIYGYDTSLLGNDAKESIEDLGSRFLESIKAFRSDITHRRPIIFIGHSLGGLLIKEALVRAREKSEDEKNLAVSKSCYGLLLFGVPNLGLRNEQLNSIVQGQPNKRLIQDLVVDDDSEPSPFLKRISDHFARCCADQYRVVSFFERKHSATVQPQPDGTLAKNGPKTFMVTEKSATSLGLTATHKEDNIPLNTDHSGLVKYESRIQEEYSIVKGRLKILVTEAKQKVSERFEESM